MIVYAVAMWDNFYPEEDNVVKVFFEEKDALMFLEELEESSRSDNLGIFQYEVE